MLIFAWVEHYVGSLKAALWATLLTLSPPITQIGRFTGTDCISTLFALLALYLVFDRHLLAPGIALLLFSIYVRTDNVALLPVILAAVWQRRIPVWQAAVLLAVAVGSVLLINHFAGDYGLRMLYYRNFTGSPIAPAEMSAPFSVSD